MSRPYWNDAQKLVLSNTPKPLWSLSDCYEMEETISKKGYKIWVTNGVCSNGTIVNKWVVDRDKVGFFIEQLFKRRHIVEVEPFPGFKAGIYFVCREDSSLIFEWLHRLPKNKEAQ